MISIFLPVKGFSNTKLSNFKGMAMQEMAYGDYSIFMLGDEDQRHVRIDESGLYYHDCRVNGLALVR